VNAWDKMSERDRLHWYVDDVSEELRGEVKSFLQGVHERDTRRRRGLNCGAPEYPKGQEWAKMNGNERLHWYADALREDVAAAVVDVIRACSRKALEKRRAANGKA